MIGVCLWFMCGKVELCLLSVEEKMGGVMCDEMIMEKSE